MAHLSIMLETTNAMYGLIVKIKERTWNMVKEDILLKGNDVQRAIKNAHLELADTKIINKYRPNSIAMSVDCF